MSTLEESLLTDIWHETAVGSTVAPDGDLSSVKGLKNIQEALVRRLVTIPGTLVHRPTYGVGIRRFQNSLMSLENQKVLALRIKDQFEEDSRVEEVQKFRFVNDDKDSSKLVIFITVKIKGYGETAMEFVPFGDIVDA